MDDTEGVSRRRVLAALGACGLTTVGGCLGSTSNDSLDAGARTESTGGQRGSPETADSAARETGAPATADERSPSPGAPTELSNVRGAVYLPHRAFNHYQMWDRYAPVEIARDLTYASSLGLNALRVFVSYTVWRESPASFRDRFDHFLEVAAERGVGVLPVLFESIGTDPTPSNVERNVPVRSPGGRVLRNPGRWDRPREFVRWFSARYGAHEALLAVEIMNEPGGFDRRVAFTREMLHAAREGDETVPLTVGCRELRFNRQYLDAPLDVLQFHHNLPPTADGMRRKLRRAADLSADLGRPVWLTEWQRTRVEPPDKMLPHYQSLARVVRESDVDGDFFWQLMLNPAYNLEVRSKGRVNGLFNEDGSVYSLGDARALAGSDDWSASERRPDWVENVGSEAS